MIALLIVLVIIALIVEKYTIDHCLDNVTFDTVTSENTVDPEEIFVVTSTIENNKWMPLSHLRVRESLPDDIMLTSDNLSITRESNGITRLSYSLFVKGNSKVQRSYAVSLPRRGRYFFRGATLYGGDFLGLDEQVSYTHLLREVVVLPSPINALELELEVGGFLGEVSINRFIMEDPILTLGFREYTGSEPMRAISWSQSAKGNGLMVKKYDYTTEPSITVLLSVEGGTHEEIEKCFSIARSVCESLENKKIRYDFLTNATSAGAIGIWNNVAAGLGTSHLITILEGLGRATYDYTESLKDTLSRAYKRSDQGRSHIIIVPNKTDELLDICKRFTKVKGGKMLILFSEEVGKC